MEITDFEAISVDCYGTLIDWESGLAAVLGPWARSRGLALDDEALLAAYAGHEERAEAEDPDTRAHGTNESLHLATFERACLAETLLLHRLAEISRN